MPRRPARPGALKDLAPLRILTQIALLQLSYYLVAIILIAFVSVVGTGQRPALKNFFDWRELRGDVTKGWMLGLCWMLDSLVTVIPILLLIARSKLVPDFALTIHFLNLIITSIHTRAIPTNMYWWLVQATSAALMTSVGIWACQWRELRPMAFGGKSSKGTQAGATDGHAIEPSAMEEGEGYAIGSAGRSRGRDGAGAYEMVGMASREPA
ncbi:hypothetical protein LTR91_011010 [Friedmanniomyces endolithicus]|uniref:Protein SYS1 n=1 Tax=Friedmanniomyces endolithicus TaxID=329885 RepID=A0AAN6KIE8_9PEZI|nr:hypothetical protein LTR57_023727 [Friedmanniomyces endolithicus]KAK0969065.1 hypothetical protein LTS01_016411 [Friedmanniomyces endolithicus]KAK0984162.1 hypothetical protein LTR91_011010 [Friedmanniomyces endolithicus]KAK1040198.1 hypothetical protein LTS16_010587 [Friedmanniomyces endolithicus]